MSIAIFTLYREREKERDYHTNEERTNVVNGTNVVVEWQGNSPLAGIGTHACKCTQHFCPKRIALLFFSTLLTHPLPPFSSAFCQNIHRRFIFCVIRTLGMDIPWK